MQNKSTWIKIHITNELHRKFKALCAYESSNIQQKVTELIEKEVDKLSRKPLDK